MQEAPASRCEASVESTTRFFLPKESLIRKNAEYSYCYAEGKRVHTRHFLLFIAPPAEEQNGFRMGMAVSKKVGHAVVRNRIKRLLRECFRLYIRPMPGSARIVIVAKRQTGTAGLGLADVVTEILGALRHHFRQREDA